MKLPFWATLLTLCGLIILFGLGTWQLQRLEWKHTLLEALDESYQQAAPQVTAIDPSLDLKRGTITGRFLRDKNIKLSPRTHDGAPGYHVFTPFVTTNKTTLLVNRGWIGLDDDEIKTPRTRQTLTGLFRAPIKANMFVPQNVPETNAWHRLDLPQIQTALDLKALAPIILYTEDKTAENLLPVGKKPELNNNHLQYAFFWFAMAAALLSVYVLRFIIKK